MTDRSVTVVVPVYNDECHLEACLEALGKQTYPTRLITVIVVDDGSTDNSATIAQSFDFVTYVHQENNGPAAARNRGVDIATTRFVAFIDSDCEARKDWLSTLVDEFEGLKTDHTLAGLGGPHLGHRADGLYARKVDRMLHSLGLVGDYVKTGQSPRPVSHNAACNSMYERTVLKECGGFNPLLFPGEDVDLDFRLKAAGYEVWFTPRAVVEHHRVDTSKRWWRMLFAYGQSSGWNVYLHGPFRAIHYCPPLFVLAVVGYCVLLVCQPMWLPLSSQILFAGLLVAGLLVLAFSWHARLWPHEAFFNLFVIALLFTAGYVHAYGSGNQRFEKG